MIFTHDLKTVRGGWNLVGTLRFAHPTLVALCPPYIGSGFAHPTLVALCHHTVDIGKTKVICIRTTNFIGNLPLWTAKLCENFFL
jgi:hypothetical protein